MSRSAHKPRLSEKPRPVCRLCARSVGSPVVAREVEVLGYIVCLACAIRTHEALRVVYAMPEISALDRLLYQKEHGSGGWRKEPLTQNAPGWVYYIRMGDVIKIGYAADVAKRMRNYPPSAELLAAHPGTPAVEREMHKRFAADLAQGREWFRESDELVAHIAQVVEQFGDQSALAYQYTRPKTQEEKVAGMFKTPANLQFASGVHFVV